MKRNVLLAAVAICLLTSQNALAQSDIGFKELGVAVGYVSPDGLDGTFSIGGFADLGTIAPRIGLETRIDYWSQSEEAFGAEASVRDIAWGVRGKYFFPVDHPTIKPFAGTGLGLHFVEAKVTIEPDPVFGIPGYTVEDSSTELGVDLGGGIEMPMGPRSNFLAEMWYVLGDVDQFNLRVGMSFKMGQ